MFDGSTRAAAELADVNKALRESIESLATDPDLMTFVGRVLTIVAQHLGAPVAEYWSIEGVNSVKLRLTCRDGKVFVGSDIPDDCRVRGFKLTPALFKEEANVSDWHGHYINDNLLTDVAQYDFYQPLGLDLVRWCTERGVTKLLNLSLVSGGNCIGGLIVYAPKKQEFTESKIALAHALGQQVTLAIRMTELAEEARNLAIMREKEKAATQIADDLAKANQALLRGVEKLSQGRQIESLMMSFLAESLTALDAHGGAVLLRSGKAADIFRVAAVLEGHEFSLEEIESDPYLSPDVRILEGEAVIGASDTDGTKVLTSLMRADRPLLKIQDMRFVQPLAYEYHNSRGHIVLWQFPLRLRQELLGFLILALKHERVPSDGARETVSALAQQLVLAIELRRLSEESEQAAVAFEKEEAARERAAELLAINLALQQNLLRLSEGLDFQDTVEHLLRSAVKQIQSAGAYLFTCDDTEKILQCVANVQSDLKSSPTSEGSHGCPRGPFTWNFIPVWQRFVQNQEITLIDARESADLEWFHPTVRQWHLDYDRPLFLGIPLAIGKRLLGCISFTFSSEFVKSDIKGEYRRIGQSLAALAAMSIETKQLAKRAQDAALAEERNRLARDLHESLAGAFTGIYMQLQAASDVAASDEQKSRDCVIRAEDLARDGLRKVREFVQSLTISAERDAPTVEVIRRLVLGATAGTSPSSRFVVEGCERPLRLIHAQALINIIHEALGNALRFADAQNIEVRMRFDESVVSVVIADDGKGFLVDPLTDTGFGISGMKARAKRLSGECYIQSSSGCGTTVSVRLPQPYKEKRPLQ